jgi:hypothetical protein
VTRFSNKSLSSCAPRGFHNWNFLNWVILASNWFSNIISADTPEARFSLPDLLLLFFFFSNDVKIGQGIVGTGGDATVPIILRSLCLTNS